MTTAAPTRRGRKRQCSDGVLEYVADLHRAGMSLRGIAVRLNAEGVPTPGGGARWHHTYVDRLLHTHGGRAMLETRSAVHPIPLALADVTPPVSRETAGMEKVTTFCRAKKALGPGSMKKSSSSEARVATFRSSLPQHKAICRHGARASGLAELHRSIGAAEMEPAHSPPHIGSNRLGTKDISPVFFRSHRLHTIGRLAASDEDQHQSIEDEDPATSTNSSPESSGFFADGRLDLGNEPDTQRTLCQQPAVSGDDETNDAFAVCYEPDSSGERHRQKPMGMSSGALGRRSCTTMELTCTYPPRIALSVHSDWS